MHPSPHAYHGAYRKQNNGKPLWLRACSVGTYRTQEKQIRFRITYLPHQRGDKPHRKNCEWDFKKNLPITTEFITQEEAVGRFDLKRLPDHASETVRVVHVGDYDECLCIGLHVENTSQIGIFKIISYDYKEGIFRMRFKLTEAQ